MRVLTGDQVSVRICSGESDKRRHQPLSMALTDPLRKEGFAGTTVCHGVAGFGAHSVLHTAHILRLSMDLPVVMEVVDTQERLERLLPIRDEMVQEGLVTMEKAKVLRYATRKTPPEPPKGPAS